MTAFVAGILLAKPLSLNLRYVSMLYGLFYLLGGLGFWCIVSLARLKLNEGHFYILMAGVIIVFMALAIKDCQNFEKIVNRGIADLSIGTVRGCW